MEEIDPDLALITTSVLVEVDNYWRLKMTLDATAMPPLEWWSNHKPAFPYLSILAAVLLSIPASSDSVERCFSQAEITISKLRSRLGHTTLENLFVIKYGHSHKKGPYLSPREAAERALEEEEDDPDEDENDNYLDDIEGLTEKDKAEMVVVE